MPQPRQQLVEVLNLPLHGRKLDRRTWRQIERFLDQWEADVLAAARRHPAKSYELGRAQIEAFADLLANLSGGPVGTTGRFGGESPSQRAAVAWQREYTLRELQDALHKYIGRLKDELLYGLRMGLNPVAVASAMYNATQDATVNWRAIARTEVVRANAAGRLDACEAMGYERVWCPPHAGACKRCRQLLEHKVFPISEVRDVTNFGRPAREWVACIPLHPHCRHSWLPYEPDVYELVQGQYRAMEAAGLTDDAFLDEAFDSSGQLKPEYADVDFSAAKTLAVAGLAAGVWKARKPHGPRETFREHVDPDELRVDLYQRAVDADKVLSQSIERRRGREYPPPRVSLREDGTRWVVDGQHRVESHKLAHPDELLEVETTKGMSWGEEHDACREAIAKILDPFADGVVSDVPNNLGFDEPLSKFGPENLNSDVGLDPLLFEGLRLRDDVRDRLQAAWARVAGDTWADWSRLYLPAHGGPAEVVIDWPAMRAEHPEWKQLADTDLHLALVILARQRLDGADLVPGRPMDLRIAAEHTPAEYAAGVEAAADGGPVWALGSQTWVGYVPEGVEKTADVDWSIPDPRSIDHGVGITDYGSRLLGSDEYEAAIAKQAATAANSGVEHWITIHPHGEDEKGQPVLVRNNSDGTMTVVGGAGGNLNMLRLDPKRRINREAGQKATGASKVEQPVSEEEAKAKEAEREQEVAGARERLEKAKGLRADHQAQIHAYLRDELGIDVADMDGAERRKMLAKVKTAALRTLAYGPISKRDAQEGADREDLGLDEDGAPKPWPGADDQPVDGNDSQDGERTPRPQVAMTDDHAKALMDLLGHDRQLAKIASRERKVINGEARGSDANQIDWSMGGDDARARKRSAAVEQELRTHNARTLLEHADRQLDGKGKYNERYKQAFQQGGFDSVDAFAHSILGHGAISKDASKLLGVAGSAQLVAHAIQAEAAEQGKQGMDLDKVQAALTALTDEQERAITDRGLARVRQATERAAEAQRELAASERGESLYTTTMARSIAAEQLQQAKRQLGMMVGGLEATSALKVALDRQAGEKIKVGGFTSPATIKELAAKARVKITTADIARVGSGNYTLSIEPERLQGLLKREPEGDADLRARLKQIRSGEDLDREIEDARTGPGMSDQLDRNQAKGKLFLQAAGSGLLGFDPGVGKTHVAIATAMERMAAEPGKHHALIVAPTNMLRSWANTISSQGSGHTVSLVGQSPNAPEKDTSSTKHKLDALTAGSDFTIVSYESLRSYQGQLKAHAAEHGPAGAHSIVIADELQKAKNEDTGNYGGVETAVDLAREHHGDGASFMGLTGTPIEKDVSDVGAMVRLVRKAKGQPMEDRKTLRTKYGKLGQDEHIARGDKIAQFRKGLDEDLYRLSSKDAGNDLGEPTRHAHTVKLSDGHKQALQDTTNRVNQQIADYHQSVRDGTTGPRMPNFGGRDQLLDALYNHPSADNSIVQGVADEIEKSGSFHFDGMPSAQADGNYAKGDHAGDYEHKHVVFGASELSRSLFGTDPSGKGFDKEGRGGLAGELRKRGVKVFVGHGQMGSNAANDASYKAFLAHKGKAVFVTNDKNNAGISLQFGDNKGAFQHGATQLHHMTRPVNNATIQQREARILRKGALSGAAYHTYSADTPVERRLEETLERELRTQDLAANSDQQVAGKDTLGHHLDREGVRSAA